MTMTHCVLADVMMILTSCLKSGKGNGAYILKIERLVTAAIEGMDEGPGLQANL